MALQAGGEIIAQHQRQNVNRSDKNQPHIADNITVSKARESKGAEKFVSIGPNKKVAYRARFLESETAMPANTCRLPMHRDIVSLADVRRLSYAEKVVAR